MRNAIKNSLVVLGLMLASPAMAADFSFIGNLDNPNQVQTFNFTVGSPSNVTLRTFSYAGGTNSAGQVISRGGFDPILALFNTSGTLIGQNDDGGCGVVPADINGACYDTFLQSLLAPGNYTVSVAAFSNFAVGPNFSDGFQGTGSFGGRSTAWAFDIQNVGQAVQVGAVPEPAAWLTMILGMAGIGFSMRRKKQLAVRVRFA